MVPWLIWTGLLAAINLTLFIAIRGRIDLPLVILVVAAVLGTAAGNMAGDLIGLDVGRLGEFHVFGAVIGGQLALAGSTILAYMGTPPARPGAPRDGSGSGR